jgi:DNA mismatch repair protein MutS2
MDEHTFRVLEFHKILEMASSFAVTAPAVILLQRLRPQKDVSDIKHQLSLVSECRQLLSEGHSPGIEHFEDLSLLFQRLRPSDSVLEPVELRAFLPLFSSALNVRTLITGSHFPGLSRLTSGLTTHHPLKREIELAIDIEGEIKDQASHDLSQIRQSIRSLHKKIKGILEGLLRRNKLITHLQDFYITERNGRWVIPVVRDSKGHVPGVIHDISNTGETLFIEPFEIQQLGNDLESRRAEEKVEEFRIVKRLSSLVREHIHEIENDYEIVLQVDLLQSLAGFAEMMNMSSPEIAERGHTRIIKGEHPLLWKTLKIDNRGDELVPLDFELGGGNSCMVITGSNTGGKTVVLKTVGVLHLMALSGMHIPAKSGTTIPFLHKILADIGDDQSIEHNLSTFSAHITRLAEIIKESNSDTLVLIDELGTGTDPEEGGALSCALLRELKRKGTLTAVSTHLRILKGFAHSEEGTVNGAMEMEVASADGNANFRPTYRLKIGEPGRSHAFETAEIFGLPVDIIREAREFMEGEATGLESLMRDLKIKNEEYEGELLELRNMKGEVANLRSSLKDELERLRGMRKEARTRSLKEADAIVRRTKREARDVLKAMKESGIANEKKEMRKLDGMLREFRDAERSIAEPEKTKSLEELRKGQTVFLRSLGVHGIVHSVNRKAQRCRVLIKGREVEVPCNELFEPMEAADKQRVTPLKEAEESGREIEENKGLEIPGEINLIGQRVEPALSLLERYLNDASISGLTSVRIIHGFGTGRLSQGIRDYLKDHPLVRSFRRGNDDEGGEAVTVIYL